MVQNFQQTTDGKTLRIGTFGRVLIALGLMLGLAGMGYLLAHKSQAADNSKKTAKKSNVPYPRPHKIKMPADLFDGGTGWLNTSGPIELKDLKGKIVLIDFWTYCCINCMHILPDLKYLEHKYPKELVVIGCHSAKFDNEKDTENIRNAIMRYEIEHPVINDSQMRLWRGLGISSWPSVLVIDAEGNVCAIAAGEGNRDSLDDLIGKLVKYHKANGTLDETPIRFDLERNKAKPMPLRFPGKLLTDVPGNRLFISDSNHNRIVISTLDGQLIDVIGKGSIGAKNGSFAEAEFDHPQGMALVDDKLYVCDTENHLLRMADLKAKTVKTVAGTGEQARPGGFNGLVKNAALSSPWDVIHVNGWLYIAMAGPHQIWAYNLRSGRIQVYAGTGREDIQNGTLESSAFAQPSGLATDGKYLYVCDSEGSAIRRVSITTRGAGDVTTLVGTSELPSGQSLFAFGDVDGQGSKARLQHPLGVVYDNGLLYVADSYNHKIKQIEISSRRCSTWLGDGKAGDRLQPSPEFGEPAGLAIAKGQLYVADTNNHRILTVDLKTKATKELKIAGLSAPQNRLADNDAFPKDVPATKVMEQMIRAGEKLIVKIKLQLPAGYKVNPLYPASFRVRAEEGQTVLPAAEIGGKRKVSLTDDTATVTLPLTGKTGKVPLQIVLTYGYCREGKGGLCKVSTTRWNLPLSVTNTANDTEIVLNVPTE